ncbi:MAG TPA: cation:proton antiporter [Albitalea sp.]|nr:cation:proton antiporter [Albitalea sp.]
MNLDLQPLGAGLAWPVAVALAWIVGEIGHRWSALPRISLYGLTGFLLGHSQLGLLPPASPGLAMQLADIAFGLILFEFGYRVNLRWLRTNPWIGLTGLLEAATTFIAVDALAVAFGMSVLSSLLLASLAMSTSPAALMRVVNEQRSSGQVTERALHLTAINCVLAVFAFKVIVGFWTFQTSGSVWRAVSDSLVALAGSAGVGAVFGAGLPAVLRRFGRLTRDATVAFAIGVMLLVALSHVFKLSPVLATLTFGFVARHRRVAFSQTQRNFGALGDLLTIVLFVFVSATIEWHRVASGLVLALALIAVRLATKVLVVGALARVGGISWRKGVLTGAALMPISVFVILLLEQARFLGVDLVDQLAPLAAATLLLELLGPVVTQRALLAAGEGMEQEA